MSQETVVDQWIPLQKKVFSRWTDSQLNGVNNLKINDVTKDLLDGVALVELAKILTGKDTPRPWACPPKSNFDQVQNCDLALDMFTKDGVRLVGISGKDINDSNEKLTLGLIWTLILHYSVGQSVSNDVTKENTQVAVSDKSNKDALIQWAEDRTSNYPGVNNFEPYDLALCALLDSYYPDKINYYQLDPNDTEKNAELATNVMKEVGIPVYVYPDELESHENKVDQKTLLTQLSTAKTVLDRAVNSEEEHTQVEEEHTQVEEEEHEQVEEEEHAQVEEEEHTQVEEGEHEQVEEKEHTQVEEEEHAQVEEVNNNEEAENDQSVPCDNKSQKIDIAIQTNDVENSSNISLETAECSCTITLDECDVKDMPISESILTQENEQEQQNTNETNEESDNITYENDEVQTYDTTNEPEYSVDGQSYEPDENTEEQQTNETGDLNTTEEPQNDFSEENTLNMSVNPINIREIENPSWVISSKTLTSEPISQSIQESDQILTLSEESYLPQHNEFDNQLQHHDSIDIYDESLRNIDQTQEGNQSEEQSPISEQPSQSIEQFSNMRNFTSDWINGTEEQVPVEQSPVTEQIPIQSTEDFNRSRHYSADWFDQSQEQVPAEQLPVVEQEESPITEQIPIQSTEDFNRSRHYSADWFDQSQEQVPAEQSPVVEQEESPITEQIPIQSTEDFNRSRHYSADWFDQSQEQVPVEQSPVTEQNVEPKRMLIENCLYVKCDE